MGNAAGGFQVSGAQVFSIALGYGHARKLGRGPVAETAVWTLLVIFHLPLANFPACVEQAGEPAYPQALFAQSAVEALHMCVLGWLARLNVAQIDLPLQRPGQETTTSQFRTVVTANCHWASAHGGDLIQHPRHAPAGEASIHFQRQTLPRVDIDHTQHANHASCGKHIMSEIQGPLLVSAAQHGARHRIDGLRQVPGPFGNNDYRCVAYWSARRRAYGIVAASMVIYRGIFYGRAQLPSAPAMNNSK